MRKRNYLTEIILLVVLVAGMAGFYRHQQKSKTSPPPPTGAALSPNYTLAVVSNFLDNGNSAISLLTEHLKNHPRDANAYFQRGIAYMKGWQYPEAADDFRSSLEIDPSQHRAWNNLSYSLTQVGDHGAALEAAERSLELRSNYSFAFGSRATALLGLGRNQEALESFRRALELSPKDSVSAWGIHEALLRLGRDQEAEQAELAASKLGLQPWREWPTATLELSDDLPEEQGSEQ